MSEQELSVMNNTLNVLVIKDGYAWLNSMRKLPWHANNHFNLPWAHFLLLEWYSELGSGEADLHPTTKEKLLNIFQLRAAKLLEWQKVMSCLPYTYTVRYEDLLINTTQVILDIADKFKNYGDLQMTPDAPNSNVCVVSFGTCVEGTDQKALALKKRQYYLKREYLEYVTPDIAQLIYNNLNMELENSFGYNYDYLRQFYPDLT